MPWNHIGDWYVDERCRDGELGHLLVSQFHFRITATGEHDNTHDNVDSLNRIRECL